MIIKPIKPIEEMTCDELSEHCREFIRTQCSKKLTMEQQQYCDLIFELKEQRWQYEFVRNALDIKGITERIKSFQYFEISMDDCGCCPMDNNADQAKGVLEDGRGFTVDFHSGVEFIGGNCSTIKIRW